MKPTLFVLSIMLCIISGCKDAVMQSNDIPFLMTKQVAEINGTGATFEATLLTSGKDLITDFGFIWSTASDEYKVSLLNKSSVKDFKIRIKSDLILNQTYSCKAYIRTTNKLVYGNKVEFKSLGSFSPVILNFYPKEGFDGDTVTISGHYFSSGIKNNKVFVNNIPANITSFNDSIIVFIMPGQSFTGQAAIALEVNSNRVTSVNKFNILGPQILSVSSLSELSGRRVTFYGTNFTQNGPSLNVTFDNYYAQIFNISATSIDVIVPIAATNLLSDNNVTLKLTNGLKSVSYSSRFTIKKSWQTKSHPLTFSWVTNYEAGFTYNDKGYMLDRNYGYMYQYNPLTDMWNKFGQTAFPGTIYICSLYIPSNDNLFRVGGFDFISKPISELWVYNFTSNKWTKKNDIPFSYTRASYFKIENQFYVLTYEGQLWQCDFEKELYKRLNDFPVSFSNYFMSTFTANGNVFAVQYGKTWMYDKQNDSWIPKAANVFTEERYSTFGICFTYNNTGYELNNGTDLYKYDYINDQWILTSKFPGVYGSISEKSFFVIGNQAYIAAIYSYYDDGSPLMYSFQD